MAQGWAFYKRGDLGGAFSTFNTLLSLSRFREEIIKALDFDLAIEEAWRDIEQVWLLVLSMATLSTLIY
jgi:hypothetical protein